MVPIIPKMSPYVFGIDLGTSNSAIAVHINGQAELIPIESATTMPSVVSVRPDGEILVGRQARSRLMVYPDETVASIKREMGFFGWVKAFAGLPGREFTPPDLSAEILSKLKTSAEQESLFALKGTPHRAVVCIPANFNESQKEATLEAARLANLEVLHLLEEPVAAAIAYAVEKERDQTILVYDLGGGTFDVSILQVDSTQAENSFKILAKDGVPKLGGDDFDGQIMAIAHDAFKVQSGLDLMDLKKDQGISQKAIREAQQRLKEVAEAAKRELSESQTTEISLPNLIRDESGQIHSLEISLTRAALNEAIRPLIWQTKAAIERALEQAGLSIDDLDRIILVGGSTRIPLVSEMLVEMFGKEPYKDTDPDTVVARGAAIYAASLLDPEKGPSIKIYNQVTHFLGISALGGKFACLLEKGLEIPVDEPLTVTQLFRNPIENMTEILIRVYQSNMPAEWTQDKDVQPIGEFAVKIAPKPKGQEEIEVTFAIDQQNLLKVKAKSSVSGNELEIDRS
jgi:molecular chaperone DnaK